MTHSTRIRIQLTNAIVAAEQMGGAVVFDIDPATAILESLDKADIVRFNTSVTDGQGRISLAEPIENKDNV